MTPANRALGQKPTRLSFWRSLISFLFAGRLWLVPVVVLLILISLLAAFGGLAPYASFLYPL